MRWLNKLAIPFIILIITLCANNIQWGGDHWKNIVEADGKGYYAHLPAVFIYRDLNFSFFDSVEKKYRNPSIFYDYRVNCHGKIANKYFVGTAVAMCPFFLIAHGIASAMGLESDGYSKIYLVFINIAAIFYLFLGLFYLKKLLLEYEIKESLISISLFLIVFSTNLFFYSVREPSMSHVYSFAFITAFIYYSKKYFDTPRDKTVIVLALLLGVIILIRPVNGIVVLIIPFVAGSWPIFKTGFNYMLKNYVRSLVALLLMLSIVAIQCIVYKIQTGYFLIDSYGEESFNWLSPHPIDFLFSYKKGLFVYTPVLFLSLSGLVVLFKTSRFQFYSMFLFLIILVYVLSSWWNWWYGGSFGTRVMLEYYAVFLILLVFSLRTLQTRISKFVFYSCLFFTLIICQIQTFQYRYYHIHWEKMDKEHFWRNFLRIDQIAKSTNLNEDLLKE